MATGIHQYFAFSMTYRNTRPNQQAYFLGSFIGDNHNDENFAARLKRVEQKLVNIYGYGNFTSYWCPAKEKLPKTRTPQQRFKKLATEAFNKYKREKAHILSQNLMFPTEFIAIAHARYRNRIELLRNRYGQ